MNNKKENGSIHCWGVCGEEEQRREEILDSEVKGGFTEKDTLNGGQESISGSTGYKGPKAGRNLMHSRNLQEINRPREKLKGDFQDCTGN